MADNLGFTYVETMEFNWKKTREILEVILIACHFISTVKLDNLNSIVRNHFTTFLIHHI